MKKLSVIISLITLCAALLLNFYGCETSPAEGEDLWLSNVSIEATISPNGDMMVSETWKARTSTISANKYRSLYRTIGIYDSAFDSFSEVVLVSVINNDTGESYPIEEKITRMDTENAYTYYADTYSNVSYIYQLPDTTYEIGCLFPPIHNGDTISLTFNYLLKDYLRKYADTVEMIWKPFTSFSLYIEEMEMRIVMPEGVDFYDIENTYVWFNINNIDNKQFDKNVLNVKASKIKSNTEVGIHVLVARDKFGDLSKTSNRNMKDYIISQES